MYVASLLKQKSAKCITIAPGAPVSDAIRLLHTFGIGAVVSVDRQGMVCGILSERDIIRGLATHGAVIMSQGVAELMTRTVHTCRPSDTVVSVMAAMSERNIRHLPVIDRGRLIGMISLRDVVRERLLEVEDEVVSIREYMEGDYVLPPSVEHSYRPV